MLKSNNKILIVEDDNILQEFYRILFRKLGIDIIILEDGDKIISTLQNENISLIIMDINLRNTYLNSEKYDGIKLSRYIKENFNNSSIPIILVTAYSPNYCGDNLLRDSLADDYILKPIVSFDKLIQKVNRLLNER